MGDEKDITYFPARHSGYKQSEITEDGMQTIEEYGKNLTTGGGVLLLAYTAAGYKHGCEVDGYFTKEEVEDLTSTLNEMGVNVARRKREWGGPDETGEREQYQLFATRDDQYDEEFFERFAELEEQYKGQEMSLAQTITGPSDEQQDSMESFHRTYGEFLGYPEPAIDDYVQRQYDADILKEIGSGLAERIRTIVGGQDRSIEDVSVSDDEASRSQIFYGPADDEASLDDARRTSKTRYLTAKAIDDVYGTHLTERAEEYAEFRKLGETIPVPEQESGEEE